MTSKNDEGNKSPTDGTSNSIENQDATTDTSGSTGSNDSDDNKSKQFLSSLKSTLRTIADPYAAGTKFREQVDSSLRTIDSAISTFAPGSVEGEDALIERTVQRDDGYYLSDRLFALETNLKQRAGKTGDATSSSKAAAGTVRMEGKTIKDGVAVADWNRMTTASLGTDIPLAAINTDDAYVPEVLVVAPPPTSSSSTGGTAGVGPNIVRRLLLRGMRVRVLVPNLYSTTLNAYGTNVVYCQGDLANVESLEYALTDVDKIIYCPMSGSRSQKQKSKGQKKKNAKQRDADLDLLQDVERGMINLLHAYQNVRFADYGAGQAAKRSLFKFRDRPEDFDLFDINREDEVEEAPPQVEEVPQVAVDSTPTAGGSSGSSGSSNSDYGYNDMSTSYNDDSQYESEYDKYKDDDPYSQYDKEYGAATSTSTSTATTTVATKQQPTTKKGASAEWRRWMKNKFDHAVFLGQVPDVDAPGGGGEASIISTRLRAQRAKKAKASTNNAPTNETKEQENGKEEEEEEEERGIDLSRGFEGFVCRLCGDGKHYEAYVRTGAYDTHGVEYVYKFRTETKPAPPPGTMTASDAEEEEEEEDGRKPRPKAKRRKRLPKFISVRMPFSKFQPMRREDGGALVAVAAEDKVPKFNGKDVRHIGFRFRADENADVTSNKKKQKQRKESMVGTWSSAATGAESSSTVSAIRFYLSLSYMKLYRANVEPEFVYVSNANVPPVVTRNMVKQEEKEIVLAAIADEKKQPGKTGTLEKDAIVDQEARRSAYQNYRGEQLLRNSGLSYAIARVADFNDGAGSDLGTVTLRQSNENVNTVSSADVAEICVRCLLDPVARNVAFYVGKKRKRE